MRTIKDYIIEEQNARKIKKSINLDAYMSNIYKLHPELEKMEQELLAQRSLIWNAILDSDEVKKEEAEKLKMKIQQERDNYLVTNNIPLDYADGKPICDKCNDSGFIRVVGGEVKVCSCMRDAKQECFDNSGMSDYKFVNIKNYRSDYCGFKERRDKIFTQLFAISKKSLSGNGIYIYSDSIQSGKTYLAVLFAKLMISLGESSYYVKQEDLSRIRESVLDDINEVRFLIIDDFSSELTTVGYNGSILNSILEKRIAHNLPTIIVTSEKKTEIISESDVRIAGKLQKSVLIID